jgi:hypothetical protein
MLLYSHETEWRYKGHLLHVDVFNNAINVLLEFISNMIDIGRGITKWHYQKKDFM